LEGKISEESLCREGTITAVLEENTLGRGVIVRNHNLKIGVDCRIHELKEAQKEKENKNGLYCEECCDASSETNATTFLESYRGEHSHPQATRDYTCILGKLRKRFEEGGKIITRKDPPTKVEDTEGRENRLDETFSGPKNRGGRERSPPFFLETERRLFREREKNRVWKPLTS